MADETNGELPEEAISGDDDQDIVAEEGAEEVSQEEAEPQEGEETDPGEESEPAYTVTIDGEERQLSKSEIEKGLMLHKAFTQKTQALAEERRQWESAVAQAREALQREVEPLKGWLEFYQAQQAQEPDWDTMSPAEEVLARRQWNKEAAKREQARTIYQQIQQQEMARQQEQFVAALYTEFPTWQDKTVMMREVGEIYTAAGHYGLTQDDVNQMMDPRAFKVLKDAAAYRALQGKKTEVQARVTEAPKKPPIRGQKSMATGLDQRIRDLEKKHRASPSFDTAAQISALRRQKVS